MHKRAHTCIHTHIRSWPIVELNCQTDFKNSCKGAVIVQHSIDVGHLETDLCEDVQGIDVQSMCKDTPANFLGSGTLGE